MTTLAPVTLKATADPRSSLTGQYLMGATIQARDAARIEAQPHGNVTELEQIAHRSYVVGAIMQATAALECEIWEVMTYGPGPPPRFQRS